MKVDIVGNCCTWTRQLCTSYIIDDEILFDAPSGSFKTLMHDYDLKKINYIIISHFHSDHFLELFIVFDYIFKCCPNKKLTLIAPKGCQERLDNLFRILEISYLTELVNRNVTFIDSENNKKVKLGQYSIQMFKMAHGELDAYGYVINNVGFTGDTSMCNNVRKILKKSSACFIDTAAVAINNKHMAVGEVIALQDEFSSCKLYPMHLSEMSMQELDYLGKRHLSQGETVYID